MASHDPSNYRFSTPAYVLLYTTILTAYYMCDLFTTYSVLLRGGR